MAPKRGLPVKALAATGPKRRKVDDNAGFVEKTFASAQASPNKSKHQPAQSLDAVVARCIRDNFRGWTQAQLSSKLVDGQSLFERLKADRCRKDKEGFVMGKLYYAEIRRLYAPDDSPSMQLVVADPSQAVDEGLKAALQPCYKAIPARSQLVSWLRSASAVNQRSIVGLFKYLLTLNPWVTSAQLGVLLEAMTYIAKADINRSFVAEFQALKPHLDDSLCAAWAGMKKEGLMPADFVAVHGSRAAIVWNGGEVERLLKAKGNPADHADLVLSVCGSSKLGEAMFGFAAVEVVMAKLSNSIQTEVDKLAAAVDLTEDAVQTVRSSALAAIDRQASPVKAAQKRSITITYRNFPVDVEVKDSHEELELRIAAVVKSRAADLGVLPGLWVESEIAEGKPGVGSVSEALLKPFVEVRKAMHNACPPDEVANMEYLHAILAKKSSSFKLIDGTCGLELALWQGLGEKTGERVLTKKVLEALPSAEQPVALDVSLRRLAELESSSLYKLCSKSVQMDVGSVKEYLSDMERNRCPSVFGRVNKGLLRSAIALLPNFLTCTVGGKVLVGQSALNHLYEQYLKECSAKAWAKDNFAKINVLSVYKFMLGDSQKENLHKWVRQAEAEAVKIGTSLHAAGPAKDAGVSSSSSSSKKAPKPKEEVRAVDHLFN